MFTIYEFKVPADYYLSSKAKWLIDSEINVLHLNPKTNCYAIQMC